MDNTLYHHGILGMKWGVRRYQNADGSYTKAGLERYRKSESEYNNAREKYVSAKKGGDLSAIQSAKSALQNAHRKLDSAYDAVKKGASADKGKILYESGYDNSKSASEKYYTTLGKSLALDALVYVANYKLNGGNGIADSEAHGKAVINTAPMVAGSLIVSSIAGARHSVFNKNISDYKELSGIADDERKPRSKYA